MKDGLPDQLVNSMMQDSHGFIWVATPSGLSKFDGMRFTTYRNNPLSTNSLKSNLFTVSWKTKWDDFGSHMLRGLICSIHGQSDSISIGLIRDPI